MQRSPACRGDRAPSVHPLLIVRLRTRARSQPYSRRGAHASSALTLNALVAEEGRLEVLWHAYHALAVGLQIPRDVLRPQRELLGAARVHGLQTARRSCVSEKRGHLCTPRLRTAASRSQLQLGARRKARAREHAREEGRQKEKVTRRPCCCARHPVWARTGRRGAVWACCFLFFHSLSVDQSSPPLALPASSLDHVATSCAASASAFC
jgi:hypothetical protein